MSQVSQKMSEVVQMKDKFEQAQADLKLKLAENASLREEVNDLRENVKQLKTVNALISQQAELDRQMYKLK